MSDFNRDGFADLVVGIPGESPGSGARSGSIAILQGSSEVVGCFVVVESRDESTAAGLIYQSTVPFV